MKAKTATPSATKNHAGGRLEAAACVADIIKAGTITTPSQ